MKHFPDNFILGAADLKLTKKSTSLDGNGQYMWTAGNVSIGKKIFIRGYMTYQDKDGVLVTIYTDILTGELPE